MKIRSQQARLSFHRVSITVVTCLCALAVVPFFGLLWQLFSEGWAHLDAALFTRTSPQPIGILMPQTDMQNIPGGILDGIYGGFLVVSMAVLLAVPLGILAGIYMWNNPSGKATSFVCYACDILRGAPSIITGLVVYWWIVLPADRFSALGGSCALAIILLPMIVRNTLSALETVPPNLKESGVALGGSVTRVTFTILLPAVRRRLWGSILFSVTRILGLATPLIITALGTSQINWDVRQPVNTVSMLIWYFFNNPVLHNLMWSAALFVVLVIILNLKSYNREN